MLPIITIPAFIMLCVLVSCFFLVYSSWKIMEKPFVAYEERYLQEAGGKLEKMYLFLPPNVILYLKYIGAFVFGFTLFFILSSA